MCDNLSLAWCKNWKHKACLVPEVMRSLWLTGRFKTLAVTGTSPPTYNFRLPVVLVQPAFHLFHKKQAKITSHPGSGFSSTEQAAHMGNISNIWVEGKKKALRSVLSGFEFWAVILEHSLVSSWSTANLMLQFYLHVTTLFQFAKHSDVVKSPSPASP